MPKPIVLAGAMPLSNDYREVLVLLIALLPSGYLTYYLNKKYNRNMSNNAISLLLAAGLVVGGGIAEILKVIIGSDNDWSIKNSVISIVSIWAVSALLSFIYIVKGHATTK